MKERIIKILQNEVTNAFNDCGNPFPVIDGDKESIEAIADKICAVMPWISAADWAAEAGPTIPEGSTNAMYDEADLDENGNPLPADEGCSIYDPDYRNLCMDCGMLFWTKLPYAVHCPKCIEEERYKK